MDDLYRKIEALCKERNISITTMCRDSGVSRAPLSDLKMGRSKTLSSATLSKIASYFGVSVDYLLGNEKENSPVSHSENEAEQLQGVYLRLAKGAQELGLDDEDVDTILALYRKHKSHNNQE